MQELCTPELERILSIYQTVRFVGTIKPRHKWKSVDEDWEKKYLLSNQVLCNRCANDDLLHIARRVRFENRNRRFAPRIRHGPFLTKIAGRT